MPSAYPGAIDDLHSGVIGTDTEPLSAPNHPDHHELLADAVEKIEAELGVAPSAAFATLVLRLADMDTAIAARVLASLYDANTILTADSDNTPAALTMGASTILARLAAGNIVAATPAQILTLLGVTAAGLALIDDATVAAQLVTLGTVPTVVAAPTPAVGVSGSYWYDSTNKLLYFSNGTIWVCITPQSASVAAVQTTTSTSYADLATSGPAVTITTGTAALVTINCYATNDTGSAIDYLSFAVSGATTVAAADGNGTQGHCTANFTQTLSRTFKLTGLTAGANTFTMKYRVNAGTGTFGLRDITVVGVPT